MFSIMDSHLHNALLTTVNAPYKERVDSLELAACIGNGDFSVAQVGSFFSEVDPDVQKAFAAMHGISEKTLVQAARNFVAWSGQYAPLAA